MKTNFSTLFKRGQDFLGTAYPLLGGAMTWVSDQYLVSSISNNGGFGVLACGSSSPDDLALQIEGTKNRTHFPFGVNIVVFHPQIQDLLEVCIQHKVSHVVLAGGRPSKNWIDTLHRHSIKVMGFAPSLGMAHKLVRCNIDGLIIEGSEAGGHVGPVSTQVLAQEILPHIRDVPVFVAGGIGRGEAILAYLEMGASGCQLGTCFVCAVESRAHPSFKKAFIDAASRDAVISPQLDHRFPVIPVRALANEASKAFLQKQRDALRDFEAKKISYQEAQIAIERFWVGALRKAVVEGNVTEGSVMAGQSVGMVHAIEPVHSIIQRLIGQMEEAIKTRSTPPIGPQGERQGV